MNKRYFAHDDGTLFRFDEPGKLAGRVIRENFRKHHSRIETGADLRATLRAGPYAWPGGYPLFFYTSDGATLSFDAVRDNLSSVIWSIRNDCSDGWRVVGIDIDYGEEPVYCDHTGEVIQ
jgi:hypothetical protein